MKQKALVFAILLVIASMKSGAQCPGTAVIGDLSKPPEIFLDSISANGSMLYGRVNNVDPRNCMVTEFALTNIWYVQPYANAPYTPICQNGTWSCYTHPWKRLTILLVDTSKYISDSGRYTHPALEPGVLAWVEYPRTRPDLPIQWSGHDWGIKEAEDRFAPGPNFFSGDTLHIWVDRNGYLHLRIVFDSVGGRWMCPEIYLTHSMGYGTYTFHTVSRIDSLDLNAIFSMFLYEYLVPEHETDMEWSLALANPFTAQYVVQPYTFAGNMVRYYMPSPLPSSHRLEWAADHISFTSWRGLGSEPSQDSLILKWTYRGSYIQPPGREQLHFNLWLFGGRVPQYGVGNEIVITSFSFQPLLQTNAVADGSLFPTRIDLLQNYPNPFNPSTVIQYTVAREAVVQVTVMDVLGRTIERLVDERKMSGRYEVRWNPSAQSSGVYFYQLHVDGAVVATKKALLLK